MQTYQKLELTIEFKSYTVDQAESESRHLDMDKTIKMCAFINKILKNF